MNKGKLIVLEGIDGSGKSTQYNLICEKLKLDNIQYKNIVFPRYTKESSALLRMYLNGQFGSHPSDVNAYTASTFFAVDRFASYKEDWGKYYENGGLIFSDRYTTSNAIHQGSKLNEEETEEFLSWLADLEYNKMCLPKPDLVIYLDVSLDISKNRMRKRENETNTNADIHELDEEYLAKCLKTANFACDFYGWKRINYLNSEGNEFSVEEKNNYIYELIKEYLHA